MPASFEEAEFVAREHLEGELERGVEKSKKRGREERKRRLEKANPRPSAIQIISWGFRRNPDVIAEVLERAQGKCECCHRDAPFLRAKDGSPYLEAHHKIPLSRGGEDTVENTIAVCPNCHMELHYGMKAP